MDVASKLTGLDPLKLQELQDLLNQAEQGDASVLPALRQALDAWPEIWQRYGDLALQAEETWKQLVAGSNWLLRESLGRKLDDLKTELTEGHAPSPLEKLLIERVVACWLQLQHADMLVVQTQNLSPGQYTILERRQNFSQGRFVKAIQALVTVRKLLQPVLSPLQIATGLKSPTAPARRSQGRLAVPVGSGN